MTGAALETVAGVSLDLAIGDPRWLPHPVRGIGWLIVRLEIWLRSTGLPLRVAGVALWLLTVGLTTLAVVATLWFVPRPWPKIYWIFSMLAIRDLDWHAERVADALRRRNLDHARLRLAWMVGRDTESLTEPEIVRATIETVAENLSDGIVAPLFYLAFGGPAAMAAYKAVNTLDSMVGYRNEKYRELGWFSARADDLANWIPARITAALIWLISLLPGFFAAQAIRITLRDGSSQPSPNAGYPEAAVAGALGVRLGGSSSYGGTETCKAYLGDPDRQLDLHLLPRVRILLYSVALIAAIGACLR